MSEEDNKAAVRRFFEDGWNNGDLAQVKAFLADEFVSHNSLNSRIQNSDDYCAGVVAYRAAFPDLITSVEDVIAQGDRVVVRGTDRGTHQGEFMGKAASGRHVACNADVDRDLSNGVGQGFRGLGRKRHQDVDRPARHLKHSDSHAVLEHRLQDRN